MVMEFLMSSEARTVLLAVDGSSGSDLAVEWAIKNYCGPLDKVHLIHIRRSFLGRRLSEYDIINYFLEGDCCFSADAAASPLKTTWNMAKDAAVKMEKRADSDARAVIDKYIQKFADAKIKCKYEIAVGREPERICKQVMKLCSDILILGSRGHGCQSSKSLGSVSDYCARHCICPVIIVKEKEPKEEVAAKVKTSSSLRK